MDEQVRLVALGAAVALAGVVLLLLVVPRLLRVLFRVKYPVPAPGSAVIITGASSGIGNHAAIHLAKSGFVVYAGVRKQQDVDSLNDEQIANLRPFIIDVEKTSSIEAAVAHLKKELEADKRPLAALINNAGIAQKYPMEYHPMAALRKIFEIHVFGGVDLTQRLLPLLRRDKGRVIFLGSFTGLVTVPLVGGYGASKNALESIADAMRLELLQHKVAVSVLEPAFVSSQIFGKITKAIDEDIETSEEILASYGWFVRPEKRAQDREKVALAVPPTVTSDLMLHVLTTPYPRARYVCAKVGKVPAWFLAGLQWGLPTELRDVIMMKSS